MSFDCLAPHIVEEIIHRLIEYISRMVVLQQQSKEKSYSILYHGILVVVKLCIEKDDNKPIDTIEENDVERYAIWKTENLFHYVVELYDLIIVHKGQFLRKEKDGATTVQHFTLIEPIHFIDTIFQEEFFLYDMDAFKGVSFEKYPKKSIRIVENQVKEENGATTVHYLTCIMPIFGKEISIHEIDALEGVSPKKCSFSEEESGPPLKRSLTK